MAVLIIIILVESTSDVASDITLSGIRNVSQVLSVDDASTYFCSPRGICLPIV
jgi:hypothetical protein